MSEGTVAWPDPAPSHGPVKLRRFESRDVELARALGTDPYIPMIGSLPPNPSEEEALAWIERQLEAFDDGKRMSFAIVDIDLDTAVGAIGLGLGNLEQGRASIGYAIHPEMRGRGYATSGLLALREFAWTIDGLHRLELFIETWNEPSIKVASRCGFEWEGLLRSYMEIGDERKDLHVYSAIRRSL